MKIDEFREELLLLRENGEFKNLYAALKELTTREKDALELAFTAFCVGLQTGERIERRRQKESRS